MKLSEALLLDAEFWVADNSTEVCNELMLAGKYVAVDIACIDYCKGNAEQGEMCQASTDVLSWFSLFVSAAVADEEK